NKRGGSSPTTSLGTPCASCSATAASTGSAPSTGRSTWTASSPPPTSTCYWALKSVSTASSARLTPPSARGRSCPGSKPASVRSSRTPEIRSTESTKATPPSSKRPTPHCPERSTDDASPQPLGPSTTRSSFDGFLLPRQVGSSTREPTPTAMSSAYGSANTFASASSQPTPDRKSTRLNSSHVKISYAVV